MPKRSINKHHSCRVVFLIEIQPLQLQMWSDLFLSYPFNIDKAASATE